MERKIIRIGSLNSESQQQKEIPLGVDLDKKSIENTNLTLKDEIELCNQWLDLCTEISNKWTISTSYHFKHLVERHFGLGTYVSNDAFIIAAQRRYESKPADKEGLNFYYKFKVIEKIDLRQKYFDYRFR